MLTSDERFLAPYAQARRALPAQSKLFMTLAPGPRSRELDHDRRSYVGDWATPLIALTQRSPVKAQAKVATGEGKRRIDRMRSVLDSFAVTSQAGAGSCFRVELPTRLEEASG